MPLQQSDVTYTAISPNCFAVRENAFFRAICGAHYRTRAPVRTAEH